MSDAEELPDTQLSFKRALVVDDSRSARVSLKRLLEAQGLTVELADCGEAAIDLLKHQLVDVVFMDHTMPGMDGLEALTAIKGNPRTATIPVMMYTTKEGEVYVSQARALGAVGVLPKKFEPHELFDMLLELGLVNDRRAASTEAAAGPEQSTPEADRAADEQALGMSVQALVTRILEDQHLSLRADILKSHRDFAKQVAAEVYAQQRREEALAEDPSIEEEGEPRQRAPGALVNLVAACLTAAVLVLSVLYWRTLEERNTALGALTAAAASARAAESAATLAAEGAQLARQATPELKLLDTLTWAMNRTDKVPFDELPFDAARAEQLAGLLEQLAAAGFQGEVLLEAHLGEFCLVADATGSYRLAEPDLPALSCTLIGHPLDSSSFAAERQSPEFEQFLRAGGLPPGISVRVLAHDRLSSVARLPYPDGGAEAGAWNAVAAENHRVELSLVPAG